ncbi:MAG: hypothetical protein RIT38_1094 [Bacteroidota bacterium]|jgi:hypothetical protein
MTLALPPPNKETEAAVAGVVQYFQNEMIKKNIKKTVEAGIQKASEKAAEVATEKAAELGAQAAVKEGAKLIFPLTMGQAAGTVASTVLANNAPHIPRILKSVIERLGYGGFERGLEKGLQVGEERVITAFISTIQNAGPLELFGLLNELINLNPGARFIRNGVVIGGGTFMLYQTIKVASAQYTIWQSYRLVFQTAVATLEKLLRANHITISEYTKYVQEISNIKTIEGLQRFIETIISKYPRT